MRPQAISQNSLHLRAKILRPLQPSIVKHGNIEQAMSRCPNPAWFCAPEPLNLVFPPRICAFLEVPVLIQQSSELGANILFLYLRAGISRMLCFPPLVLRFGQSDCVV
jgi:hypothetical protein